MDLEEILLISLSSISIAIIVIYSIYDYTRKRKISFKDVKAIDVTKPTTPKKKEKKPIGKIRKNGGLFSTSLF